MAVLWANLLVATFCSWQVVLAARIEITPVKFSGLVPTTINITCVPSSIENCAREIVSIQVLKDEQKMASVSQDSKIGYGKDLTGIIQVDGHTDQDLENSFLRLRMQHLMNSDSAKYTCLVYYIDYEGFVVEEKDEDNLILNDLDIQPLVKYLLHKMLVQENLMKDQAQKLKDQEVQLKSLQLQLNAKDSKYRSRFDELEDMTSTQARDIKEVMDTGHDRGERLDVLEVIMKNQSLDLFGLVEADRHTILFTAGHNGTVDLSKGDIVIFDDPVMSFGGGYDKMTGLFTAPMKGIYIFHLTVMSAVRSHTVRVDIQVNKKTKARAISYAKEVGGQSSTSCLVKLQLNDVVRAIVDYSNPIKKKMQPYPYSLFSGYLVKAL